MEYRTQFKNRIKVGVEPVGASRARESAKEECDINLIMKKFENNGVVAHRNKFNGQYADVSGAVSYNEALDIVRRADVAFMTLPAKVRAQFGNDPQAFLSFVGDGRNRDKAVAMGLVKPEPGVVKAAVGAAITPGEVAAPVVPAVK